MMSRASKESLPGGRNAAAGSQHLRRGRGLAAGRGSRDGDESLDLFARIRRSPLISSTNESGGQNAAGQHKLERASIGSAKLWRSGEDDLLSSDIGKSDYDWLLTPPGTPLFSSSDASQHQPSSTAPRSSSNGRSISATKASRQLSVSQSEISQFNRPTRSGSATHPSLSGTISSSYFSNNNRTSVLNTSSASVTSRPTTPGKRPTAASTSRTNSVSASNPVPSRPSTPSKTRTSSTTSADKPRQPQNSRPSTPTARPQVPSTNSNASSSTASARSNSRPSTPARRNPTPTPARTTSSSRSSTPNRRTPMPAAAPTMTRSLSVGHTPTTNSRNPASRSRPSSPAPQGRVPPQPLAPDFLHDIPPNFRTKLPERPISASKQRPGVPLTVQANQNSEAATAPASTNRRQSSPIVTRGRLSNSSPKDQSDSNGHNVSLPQIKKSLVSEATVRRPSKPTLSTESTGFGRTISKKSLDMALRHMDIRQCIRGASLFPQSIRPTTSKGRTGPMTDLVAPALDKAAPLDDETMPDLTGRETESNKGMISGDSNLAISEDGDEVVSSAERVPVVTKVNEDIYESSGYDAILLKDDSKNLNWLHSIEDKSHQSRVFDHRFKPLPEPFSLV